MRRHRWLLPKEIPRDAAAYAYAREVLGLPPTQDRPPTGAGAHLVEALRAAFPAAEDQEAAWACLSALAGQADAPAVEETAREAWGAAVIREGEAAVAALVARLGPAPDLAALLADLEGRRGGRDATAAARRSRARLSARRGGMR
jgi:hypothetical protein